MLGIKIRDTKMSSGGISFLSFDLKDILAVIGDEPILKSRWLCCNLNYGARKDGKFQIFRAVRLKLSGKEMTELALSIHQTYDGRFEAKGAGAAKKP